MKRNDECGEGECLCIDCEVVIVYDETRPDDAQRCDQCEAHHTGTCGEDCPIVEHASA